MLSPSTLVLQRSSEAVGRRYPLASKLELYHLSPCFSHDGGGLASYSVFSFYIPVQRKGSCSLPGWKLGTLLGLAALGQERCAQTSTSYPEPEQW